MTAITWSGSTGDWNTTSDWSPNQVPGPGDTAIIPGGGRTVDLTTPVTVGAVLISGGTLSVTDPGGTDTITGDLTVSGFQSLFAVDSQAGVNPGGSTVSIGGVLRNEGQILIGNASIGQATTVIAGGLEHTNEFIDITGAAGVEASLIVQAAAPDAISGGSFNLNGDALLQFTGGGIVSLTSQGSIFLSGSLAQIDIAGEAGENTALTGLTEIGFASTFSLADGASLTTSVGLSIDSGGLLRVDSPPGTSPSSGGSFFSIGGTLVNNGGIQLGGVNDENATAGAIVSAAGLINSGSISMVPFSATAPLRLIIAGVAPTAWTGTAQLAFDSAIVYGGGGITTIAPHAQLTLGLFDDSSSDASGQLARIEIAGDASGNSALTGLASNAGALELAGQAVIHTSAGNFDNTGNLSLSDGSSMTIAGTLTNAVSGTISLVNALGVGVPTTLTAAALDNTGSIFIDLGNAGGSPAVLAINAAAPTVWTGSASLTGNAIGTFTAGQFAELQYTGGGITSIAPGAAIALSLTNAFIATQANPNSDSALTGLASNSGSLTLREGAFLATSAGFDFTNNGVIAVDDFQFGSSTLDIGGRLINTSGGLVVIGNSSDTGSTLVTAHGLVDDGSITVSGAFTFGPDGGSQRDILVVSGGASGSGTIGVGGAHAVVEFGGAVASTLSVYFNGTSGTLALDAPALFAAPIWGMAAGAGAANSGTQTSNDQIDLTGIALGGFSSAGFDTNSDVLTIATSAGTFNFQLHGPYAAGTTASATADASGNGTDIFLVGTGPTDTTSPTLVANRTLYLTHGTTATIGPDILRFDDNLSLHPQEVYNIVNFPHAGQLIVNNPQEFGSFTQADIDAGRVSYQETAGQVGPESFAFTVQDAAGNVTGTQTFNIFANPAAAQQSPAVLDDFGWAQGWGGADNPRMLTDVNGDGTSEYIGFGFSAVFIAYGDTFANGQGDTGPGFAPAVGAVNDFGTSEGYTAQVQRGAANAGVGDGDILYGQGFAGVYWYEAPTEEIQQDATGNLIRVLQYNQIHGPNFYGNFGSQEGWSPANGFQILKTTQSDGTASILGFGDSGIVVGPQAFADGATANDSYVLDFAGGNTATTNAGNNFGWNQQNDIRAFTDAGGGRLDLNHDGIADFVGMGPQGLAFAFGNDAGPNGSYQLGPLQQAQIGPVDLGDDQGWNDQSTLRYVVADPQSGFDDILAFGYAGVYVAMGQDPATHGGQPFGQLNLAMNDFGSAQGWSVDQTPRLVGDVNGDGISDIVGFGFSNTFVALGSKDANGNLQFAIDPNLTIGDFGSSQGWSSASPNLTVRALGQFPTEEGPVNSATGRSDLVLSGDGNNVPTQVWQFV